MDEIDVETSSLHGDL